MTFALSALLLLHGLIHFMGFVKAFGWARLEQLTQPISKPWGVIWLAAALLLSSASVARFAQADWWWIGALVGVALSQILVVAFWSDAKIGTAPNVVVLIAAIVAFGGWRFQRLVAADLEALSAAGDSPAHVDVVAESDLAQLPQPVAAWLRSAGVVGRPRTREVHVRQRGRMQTERGGKWMSFEAEQWFTTSEPGFVWAADVELAPGVRLAGRDRYVGATGNMRIELLSLFAVVDAHGPTIDQGSLLRYLAETAWFPSAALQRYITWQDAGPGAARATMTHGAVTASGLFRFDERGEVASFEAQRYLEDALEQWLVEAVPGSDRQFGDRRLPARWRVTWRLTDGDWTWLELELMSVEHAWSRR